MVKYSRRQHKRKHRRSQRGGSCSAQIQRGGALAEWSTGPALLLDGAARIQAEQGPLDRVFADLPSVIPRQSGGSRRRQRGGMQSYSNAFKQSGSSRNRRRRRSRRQRGGMMDLKSAFVSPSTQPGTSFASYGSAEKSLGYGFDLMRGAQS